MTKPQQRAQSHYPSNRSSCLSDPPPLRGNPAFATGKNQIEEYSNEVEDTRDHRDRGGAGDQRVRLR
jgi:hypothetical protein